MTFPRFRSIYKRRTYVGSAKRTLQKMHALIIEIDNVAGVRGLKRAGTYLAYSLHDSYGRRYYDTTPGRNVSFVVGMACTCIMSEQPIKLYIRTSSRTYQSSANAG